MFYVDCHIFNYYEIKVYSQCCRYYLLEKKYNCIIIKY